MSEQIDILIVSLDVPSARVAQGIARVFGLDERAAQRFIEGLPRVVRRAASPAIAERYVNALRSIGARVETRPSLPPPARPEPELPAPTATTTTGLAQTLEQARASEDAIERFRNLAGVSPSMDPIAEANAANPLIPKAPPVPHDIDRMPNAILPRWSARPTDTTSPYSAAPPRDHSNAELPPAFGVKFVSDPATPPNEPVRPASVRPGPVGLAPSATEYKPRSSPRPPAPSAGRAAQSPSPDSVPRNRFPVRLGIAAIVAVAALLWLVLR